ncbi:MAG: hypothetical protein L3K26_14000 [Candidatus Hydrogenedentes bacterium]|nr:hypothetical protein [Candidatus Hydrogenedentota bacterium]
MRRLLLPIHALLLISLSASAAHPVWKTIEAIFRTDRAVPQSRHGEGGQNHPEEHTFLFDSFADLESKDFLNGLAFVLSKYPPPASPDALPAYRRSMDHKLRMLFEYYPLAARSPEDFTALLDLIYDAGNAAILRVFLLRHATTGLEPQSTFGNYMQGHLEHDGEAFVKKLIEVIQLPQESKAVQLAAMDVLLARTEHEYAALLASDALLINRSDKETPVHVRQFITKPDALPVSRRTQILLQRKNEAVGAWAKTLKAIADNGQRDPALRAKAREVLDVVLADYPIANRDEIQGH